MGKIFEKNKIIIVAIVASFVIAGWLYFSSPSSLTVIPISDRAYFPQLHQTLREAKDSIHIVMFTMRYYPEYPTSTENYLLGDLIEAKKRGVDVKVILEYGEEYLGVEFPLKQKRACSYLQDEGIEVKFDPRGVTTHAKLVIIDNKKVVLGSTNWNYYALDKNHETAALIQSIDTANYFEKYFNNLWQSSSFTDCKLKPVGENCSSISSILANKDDCDKKNVTLNGEVRDIKLKVSKAGNPYTLFYLIDLETGEGIKVYSRGHLSIFEKQKVTVKGVYRKIKTVGPYIFYNEIEAEKVE